MYIYLYLNFGARLRRARGTRALRVPPDLRKHRRVVQNRISGQLGASGALGWSVCACSGLLRPPEMPRGLASEPQVRSKVLLGPAPELPFAPKCCSGLLRSRLCTQKGCSGSLQRCQVARKGCPSQLRSRICSKKLFKSSFIRHVLASAARNRRSNILLGNHRLNVLLEIIVRSHMSL